MPDAFATQRRRPSDPATFVFDITPDDANDLAHVTTWARDRGIELGGLQVSSTELEDVYLGLVGDDA